MAFWVISVVTPWVFAFLEDFSKLSLLIQVPTSNHFWILLAFSLLPPIRARATLAWPRSFCWIYRPKFAKAYLVSWLTEAKKFSCVNWSWGTLIVVLSASLAIISLALRVRNFALCSSAKLNSLKSYSLFRVFESLMCWTAFAFMVFCWTDAK